MAMPMNDMLGMLMGMMGKQRMNPDPGKEGRGPGSMQVPWHLGGSIMNKGMTSAAPGAGADSSRSGGGFNDPAAVDQRRQQYEQSVAGLEDQLRQLRAQLAQIQARITTASSDAAAAAYEEQAANLQQQIASVMQQIEEARAREQEGEYGPATELPRMGTSSNRAGPGDMGVGARGLLEIMRQKYPGTRGGSGGGSSSGGSHNPFGWMGNPGSGSGGRG